MIGMDRYLFEIFPPLEWNLRWTNRYWPSRRVRAPRLPLHRWRASRST